MATRLYIRLRFDARLTDQVFLEMINDKGSCDKDEKLSKVF
jgi:hypothetical protein